MPSLRGGPCSASLVGSAPHWNAAPPLNSNALEVYVHRLRKKLDGAPNLAIRNIRGLGYMLAKP